MFHPFASVIIAKKIYKTDYFPLINNRNKYPTLIETSYKMVGISRMIRCSVEQIHETSSSRTNS